MAAVDVEDLFGGSSIGNSLLAEVDEVTFTSLMLSSSSICCLQLVLVVVVGNVSSFKLLELLFMALLSDIASVLLDKSC